MTRKDSMAAIRAANHAISLIAANWASGDLAGAVRNAVNVQQEYLLPILHEKKPTKRKAFVPAFPGDTPFARALRRGIAARAGQ